MSVDMHLYLPNHLRQSEEPSKYSYLYVSRRWPSMVGRGANSGADIIGGEIGGADVLGRREIWRKPLYRLHCLYSRGGRETVGIPKTRWHVVNETQRHHPPTNTAVLAYTTQDSQPCSFRLLCCVKGVACVG